MLYIMAAHKHWNEAKLPGRSKMGCHTLIEISLSREQDGTRATYFVKDGDSDG